MSVASTTRKQDFTLDQVASTFDFTFPALTAFPEDIKCKATTGSTITALTYVTDYTISIDSDGVGGTVTLVDKTAVSKGTLIVYRETTNLQPSDYADYNQFPADTLERDLDKRTMVAQEQVEEAGRTVKVGITSTLTDISLPDSAADNLIGWNDTATGLENKVVKSLGTLVLATEAQAIALTNDDAYMTAAKVADSLAGGNATLSVGATVITTLTVSTVKIINAITALTVTSLSVNAVSVGTLTVSSIKVITGIAAGTPLADTLYKENIGKGWIQFNGSGTIAIQDSFNVSSITDNGIGEYTVTWDVDFANNDYAVTTAGGMVRADTNVAVRAIDIGSVDISAYDAAVPAFTDATFVSVITMGDQ